MQACVTRTLNKYTAVPRYHHITQSIGTFENSPSSLMLHTLSDWRLSLVGTRRLLDSMPNLNMLFARASDRLMPINAERYFVFQFTGHGRLGSLPSGICTRVFIDHSHRHASAYRQARSISVCEMFYIKHSCLTTNGHHVRPQFLQVASLINISCSSVRR